MEERKLLLNILRQTKHLESVFAKQKIKPDCFKFFKSPSKNIF